MQSGRRGRGQTGSSRRQKGGSGVSVDAGDSRARPGLPGIVAARVNVDESRARLRRIHMAAFSV